MKFHPAELLCALCLLVAAETWASPVPLQDFLKKAGDNNPVLKSAAWDSRIAQDTLQLSSAAYLPRIDAHAGYTLQLEPQAVIIAGRTAETQEADYAFAGVSATYTLYDFGRRESRIQQSEALANATVQALEYLKKDISLQVIEAYFGILEGIKLAQASTEEVSQVEEHRRIAQILLEEGVVTRNDVLQADVRMAAARQKLLTLKNRNENIWLKLNFLTGSPPSFRCELDDSIVLTDSSPAESNQLLTNRHDIRALRYRVQSSDFEASESRSNFFPEFYTRLGLDFVQNDKVREQAIMSATFGIKVNIFDGYATTALRQRAVNSRSKNEDTLRMTEKLALLEADTARNDVAVSRKRIGVAEAAIRQSEENLRINMERYKERVGTATEVLDAQTLVTQAKTDYFRAFYDHQTASARLQKSLGTL